MELTVGHDTIAGGLAATTHVDAVRSPETTSLPTRPDDTGLPGETRTLALAWFPSFYVDVDADLDRRTLAVDEVEALCRERAARELVKQLTVPQAFGDSSVKDKFKPQKGKGACVAFAAFGDVRKLKDDGSRGALRNDANVKSLCAYVIDLDVREARGLALIDEVKRRLSPWRAWGWTTWSHEWAYYAAWRFVVPFSVDVGAGVWARVWEELNQLLACGKNDPQTKPTPQQHALPRAPGKIRLLDGTIIDNRIEWWSSSSTTLFDPTEVVQSAARVSTTNLPVLVVDDDQDEDQDDSAGDGAIPEGQRNGELFKVGCRLKRQGLGAEELRAVLLDVNQRRCVPPLSVSEVAKVAESASKSTNKSGKGKLRPGRVDEVLALVDISGLVYDEFLEASSLREGAVPPWAPTRPGPRKLDDQDAFDVTVWLARERKTKCDEGLAGRCLWRASKNRPVDSLRDYVRGTRWDSVKRLDTWLSVYLDAEDDAYTALVGRKWMIQAVARALNPGCKADNVLVLEGKQGVQKSTALSVLGGCGRFFTDQLPDNLGDKDASLAMNGTWIVEMSDLQSLSKTRVTTMKAFITRQVDRFRPPYGKNLIDTPRRSVLAGTTNEKGYLVDETGNRRFWPVACGDEEEGSPAIAQRLQALRADVDQLWAEAVVAYDAGEPWWLTTTEEVRLSRCVQEERVVENPLALMLERRLAGVEYEPPDGKKVSSPVVQLTMEDALSWAYEMNDPNHKKDSKAVAQILLKNGFRRVRGVTKSGARPWVYVKDGYAFCERKSAVWGYGHLTQAEYVAKAEEEWLAETKRGVDALADAARGEGRAKVREKN
jgi:hypothetical protein